MAITRQAFALTCFICRVEGGFFLLCDSVELSLIRLFVLRLCTRLLIRFPNVAISIDIKDNDDELIDRVHELIVKFDRQEMTIWGNISYVVTQKCYNRVRS